MVANILVTGAAGYIGGSIVADLRASTNPVLKEANIIAAVRSDEQAKALSDFGVNTIQLTLNDEEAVTRSLLHHKIDIVIHTASAIEPSLALPLITALGKQKDASGRQTFYIHTSGLSAFYQKTGWPPGQYKDSDDLFKTEKQLADSFPIRKTDVAVTDHAKLHGVISFIVVPTTVHGRGSGPWNQLSVVIPVLVKSSVAQRKVHRFSDATHVSGVHITDLTSLYGLIVEKIIQNAAIPRNTEGYYIAKAYGYLWPEALDRLATTLYDRGLADSPEVSIWANNKVAADTLGVPEQFLEVLWNSGADIDAQNAKQIGWQPKWEREQFLSSFDAEIDDVLELGQAKSSLIDSLFKAAKA